MEESFWRERWGAGQIGFHQGRPNELLAKHASTLEGRRRVLVPLCGKAVDLRFLRELGLEVVGVEFVRDAIEAFFREQGIAATPTRSGALDGLTGGGITLLAGDFFATRAEDLGRFDALYDRAALVALEPSVRERYVAHCASMLEPGALTLLVSFEYDQSRLSGPPFSVDDATVRSLHAGCDVAVLESRVEPPGPRFVEAGVLDVHERLYAIGSR